MCIKHIVGLLYPDEGDVLVHGESVPSMSDDRLFELRKRFGLLFQDGALFGSMSVYDNVAFPLRQHTEKGEDEIEDIVMRRLKEVGLGDARHHMPNELSGGMRKRAGFARALVLEPDIVLFDEPDSGLDPVRTALLGELILEVHRDAMDEAKAKGKEHLPTYCVVTHDIMSARRVADYINVMWKGPDRRGGPGRGHAELRQPVHPPVPVRRIRGAAGHGLATCALAVAVDGCRPPGGGIVDRGQGVVPGAPRHARAHCRPAGCGRLRNCWISSRNCAGRSCARSIDSQDGSSRATHSTTSSQPRRPCTRSKATGLTETCPPGAPGCEAHTIASSGRPALSSVSGK